MRPGRSASRWPALALAFAFLQAAACTTLVRYPLSESARSDLRATKTVVVLSQATIGVSAPQCPRETGTPPPAISELGFIGALVTSMVQTGMAAAVEVMARNCEGESLKAHEAAAWPVRDALLGYDPGKALSADLARALGSLRWLQNSHVDVVRVAEKLTARRMVNLVQASGKASVLLVQLDYRLGPSFDTLVIAADVTLLGREVRPTTHAAGWTVEEPIIAYHNVLSTTGRLKNWPRGEISLQEATAVWETEGNARRVLDGGFSDLARMIAYDLEAGEPPGDEYSAPEDAVQVPIVMLASPDGRGLAVSRQPDPTLTKASGYVARQSDGRSWVRLRTGELLSYGDPYP